jgi:hypothetical protein
MTTHSDLKKLIRDRKAKTGESYTAARSHVMRERAGLLGVDGEASAAMSAAVPTADRVRLAPPSRVYPAGFGDVVELRVTLRDIAPGIWRRVRVSAEVPLNLLHEVLQIAFGWTNSHLHDFQIAGARFGMADVEDELLCVDECAAPVGAVAPVGAMFVYRYDFGDDWEHEVVVERIDEYRGDNSLAIVCLDGARACPPEDCGGPSGYDRLLEILADPQHPEYREMKTWVGRRFEAEHFDVHAVNKKLAALARRLGARRARGRGQGRGQRAVVLRGRPATIVPP